MRTIILLACIALCSQITAQNFYQRHWSKVYHHEMTGLPQSALKTVDTLYLKAKKDGNMTELVKAVLYRAKFAMLVQDDSELLVIEQMKKEIAESKAPLKNLLQSILAQVYWQHFQANRWKYYDRSTTSEVVNRNDFRTWDAPAMIREIDRHFTASLANPRLLQSVKLEKFDDVLALAHHSKMYRPTLYDFIAHQALLFYVTNENEFDDTVANDEPVAESTIDTATGIDVTEKSKAIEIYQDLLSFHEVRRDTNAYVNLQLERQKFSYEHSTSEEKRDILEKSLQKLATNFRHHPSSGLVQYELATLYFNEGLQYRYPDTTHRFKLIRSLRICDQVQQKFPDSDGAIRCKEIADRILSQKLTVKTEEFLPISQPSRLLVTYSNISEIRISFYKVRQKAVEEIFTTPSDSSRIQMIRSLTAQSAWKVDLPQHTDHQSHSTEIAVPALGAGKYLVVISPGEGLQRPGDVYAFSSVTVTDVALLKRESGGECRFQLVDRNDGHPIEDADVHLKSVDPRSAERYTTNDGRQYVDEHKRTDKNGFFTLEVGKRKGWNVLATVAYKGDTALFGNYYHWNYYDDDDDTDPETRAKIFLFTDRSIYRPGQTVYFKGILIRTKRGVSEVVGGQFVEVALEDANGEEVSTLRLKTNLYGSFSGEFKIPTSGLTGEFTLYADEDLDGSRFYDNLDELEPGEVIISVEEYKRPTFEVTMKPVKGSFSLYDSVTVSGNATAFSGAKVSRAKVAYTVTRTVRYPRWYRFDGQTARGEAEIAQGDTTTDGTGQFHIIFPALPDETISKEGEPIFTYIVEVSVTDINGETRTSTSSVQVGYHIMIASINAPSSINVSQGKGKIAVSTTNLNGEPLASKGVVRIFKLKAPEFAMRDRPWDAPDTPMMTEKEFKNLFPHDSYREFNETPSAWPKGEMVSELPFDTQRSKEIVYDINQSWKGGAYVMELTTADSLGRPVRDLHHFVLTRSGREVSDNQLLVFKTDKESYLPGETIRVSVGSATRLHATIEVVKDQKVIRSWVEELSGENKVINIPLAGVTGESAFSIHCSSAVFNSIVERHQRINIAESSDELAIETATFKDRFEPGSKQTWSFTILGKDEKVQAEVLASMYDASLDQFKPHQWEFDPIEKRYGYSHYNLESDNSFSNKDFIIRNIYPIFGNLPRQQYDVLDWFGFSMANSKRAQDAYLTRLYTLSLNKSTFHMRNDRRSPSGFVSGRIVSTEDSTPLPGVNVVVKGTTRGTVSGADGSYSIEADKDDVLVFSFIGFETLEVKASRKNIIDISMAPDVTQLSEVVVTGMGIQREHKTLGYSVMSVAESPADASEVIFEEALQGRVAGVVISNSSGNPGAQYRLMIRGMSSMSADKMPLYVIDGVPVDDSTIDASDLASIQVLKGAAATALYGARGANGVIIISTKSGQQKTDEELAKVNARKNFNETAFFFPHLSTDEDGKVSFSFTSPESLTRWKFQLLAHTKDLITGHKTMEAVTQKQLMVTPNPPRFLREGDNLILSAKISNLTAKKLEGKVGLSLTNAATGAPVDATFGNVSRNFTFTVDGNANTEVSWTLSVPKGIEAVQYRIVAKAGSFSDGEQNVLPVLSNRILVTETLPLQVRGGESKTFTLDKLRDQSSGTLQHHRLTIEVTSNPAWYAIQALPYLMEFPHECAEQLFSRYYANSIAAHVVNTHPSIKKVFDQWRASGELKSNLEKNAALKSILIEETPWLRDAQSETEKQKRIAMLFDATLMSEQLASVVNKMTELQLGSGGFPWFSGGYENYYITQHIVTTYGHLSHLKIKTDGKMSDMMLKALKYLDAQFVKQYNEILLDAERSASNESGAKKTEAIQRYLSAYTPGDLQVHYLYMRSFFPNVVPEDAVKQAIQFMSAQAGAKWQQYRLYIKGMIALIQNRNGDSQHARAILKSLKENAIVSDEFGMYWKENQSGYYWNEAPVETQALLIEAFSEITGDDGKPRTEDVNELRIWLLKHKQTNAWQTTKATTEGAYALLLTGTEWLHADNAVSVVAGGEPVRFPADQVQAGTGHSTFSWNAADIKPQLATVTLSKKGDGIAWGGMYWQYFEDLDRITSAETALKLRKDIFKVSNTAKGELLHAVEKEVLHPGDLIRVRLELTVDRPLEFLHLKDLRAAGLEPVEVLSEYKWQEGLGYYQSTRDVATHFFFDYAPKGIYVFEYDLRVNIKGNFSNGITTIQSMYAPELSSQSKGTRITVE